MEKISIILPVFNEEILIKRCIESVLNQKYKNFELIIIDDGSTDNTLNNIKEYKDKRIQIYSQRQQGTGQARNKGLENATGDFICFIDSDDTINSGFLEKMMKLMKENSAQLVACSYKRNTEKIYKLEKEEAFKYLISLPEKIPMSVCGKIFSKEIIKGVYFDPNNNFEDIKFAIEAFSKADNVVYIEEVLYNYIQKEESRSKYFETDDRMRACFENIELIDKKFPKLINDYITYSLFNSIAIANMMILNNMYNDKILKKIKQIVANNIYSVIKSKYNILKKWQIYIFYLNFDVYRRIYCIIKGKRRKIMTSNISVIVPIYNSKQYLNECIESILNQTYKDFELILVNDGSTDESKLICNEYLKKNNNIKVLNQENRGVSSARNKGISIATGNFLCFVDSDDKIDKSYLENLIELQKKYNADIVEVATCYMQKNKLKRKSKYKEEVLTAIQMMSRLYSEEGINGVLITNKLFNKQLFKKIRFEEGHKNEDEFIIHKLIYESKEKIVVCNKKLYYYRIHKGSRQRTFSSRKIEVLDVFDEREKYFETDDELKTKNKIAKIDMILFLYAVCNINKQKEEEKYLKEIFLTEYNNIDFKLNLKRKVKYWIFNKFPNIIAKIILFKRRSLI